MKALFAAVLLSVHAIGAQTAAAQTAATQQRVPIRELAPIEAASTEAFANIFGVRAIANGEVLVNDALRRQVVVLDRNLALARVVLDSSGKGPQLYGPRSAPTIPYLGDSTLFVDVVGRSLVVIDGHGNVARVMAAPNQRDLDFLYYSPALADADGNLVYQPIMARFAKPDGTFPPPPDSQPLVRANFATRTVDTIGRVKVPTSIYNSGVQRPDGKVQTTKTINPVTTVDVWSVFTDGTLAFVRGHDYHIDLLSTDGRLRSAPKLPFDWKRLTDEDKLALIDSSQKAEEKALRDAKANVRERQLISQQETPRGIAPSLDPIIKFVPLSEMADYHPAVRYGAAKADADNNLWILPTTSAQSRAGELVYDVVNNKGELTHRVRVPANRSIAGFGPNGVVFLMFRDDANIWHIERTRVTTTLNF